MAGCRLPCPPCGVTARTAADAQCILCESLEIIILPIHGVVFVEVFQTLHIGNAVVCIDGGEFIVEIRSTSVVANPSGDDRVGRFAKGQRITMTGEGGGYGKPNKSGETAYEKRNGAFF